MTQSLTGSVRLHLCVDNTIERDSLMRDVPTQLIATPGSRLRRWRQRQGMSLREVADLTGVSESMLSLVERHLRALSPISKVRLARLLRVRVRDLFEIDG